MARFLAAAAAAATGVQVGSAMVATRFVVDQTGPTSLALLRYVIGFCCLLPVVWLSAGPVRFARRDVLPIALLGITQFGILIALLNYGLRFIPSARAALIFATFPLLTMVLAVALGHERLTLPKILGVLLTIAGVGLALGEKALQGGGAQEWVGELAVFASASSGAVCSVLYRPYLRKYPALPVSAFAMLASVGFLAILAAGEGFFVSPPRFTQRRGLLPLAVGPRPRSRHPGHGLSRPQPRHRRRARRPLPGRSDLRGVRRRPCLRRPRPLAGALARARSLKPPSA